MTECQGGTSLYATFNRFLAKARLSSEEATLEGLAKVWSKLEGLVVEETLEVVEETLVMEETLVEEEAMVVEIVSALN